MDWDDGRCLNDYAPTRLHPDTVAVAKQLLGRRCIELASDEMDRIESSHRLFAGGLLTLSSATIAASQ